LTNQKQAWLGTGVVALRAVPLVLHSTAHMKLGIFLPSILANAYIVVVLFVAPIVAAGLLWTRRARAGAWLLFWSMLGSLLFELYHHFMVMSPDHVSQVPDDLWGHIFQLTAIATALLEAAGCFVAVYLLYSPMRRSAPLASADRGTR
jgi:hypothetical protein